MEIQIEQVQKRYGSHTALRGVDLQIREGMFGLLGPNGAGKTTLLRILATLLRPTSGRVVIGGYDISHTSQRKAARALIGYLPQELGLYPDLTGREFLEYMGLLKRLYDRTSRRQQIEVLLDLVSLRSVGDRKIKTYSGGMKRRLGIAQVLLGNPSVMIIDEPTAGLDPEERIRLRTLLTRLAEQRVVILSTHVVEDISQTCDYIGVLDSGTLAFHGQIGHLVDEARGHTWQFMADAFYIPPPELSVISMFPQAEGTLYRVVGPRPEGQYVDAVLPTLEDGYVWLRQQYRHVKTSQTSQVLLSNHKIT